MNANVLTYIQFRKDISIKQAPFNEVDALAFGVISYLDFTDIIPSKTRCGIQEVSEAYWRKCMSLDKNYEPGEFERCLFEMANSKRYGGVSFENYVKERDAGQERTTYALTVHLNRRQVLILLPGTDTSFLSWKENFTYMYQIPAPGQLRALEYVKECVSGLKWYQKAMIIGHSKGGLLSVYASMHLEEKYQRKLTDIYLFDAPGFIYDISGLEGYQRVASKMHSYQPVDSVVGRLLDSHYPNLKIIRSSAEKFLQHSMITWEVGINGIETATAQSRFSDAVSEFLSALVFSVPAERRKVVIDEAFGILAANEINTIEDMDRFKGPQAVMLMSGWTKLSKETKIVLRKIFVNLMKEIITD